MRCPGRRLIFDGAVSAAFPLTRKLSSRRPLSSARIDVRTFVVLAGGKGVDPFRSQMTSPVAASTTAAARAVIIGPAARAVTGWASPATTTTAIPAVHPHLIHHPPLPAAFSPPD